MIYFSFSIACVAVTFSGVPLPSTITKRFFFFVGQGGSAARVEQRPGYGLVDRLTSSAPHTYFSSAVGFVVSVREREKAVLRLSFLLILSSDPCQGLFSTNYQACPPFLVLLLQ